MASGNAFVEGIVVHHMHYLWGHGCNPWIIEGTLGLAVCHTTHPNHAEVVG